MRLFLILTFISFIFSSCTDDLNPEIKCNADTADVCSEGYVCYENRCKLKDDLCSKCGDKEVCNVTNDAFTCNCIEGYEKEETGQTCVVIDVCNPSINPCKDVNRNLCKDEDSNGVAECYCNDGYEFINQKCIDINECLSHNGGCDANATCENIDGDFNCECNSGFSGNGFTCENIDDCASNPCLNGGLCNDGLNKYTCDCTDTGFDGETCDHNIDDCKSDSCQNGGTCIDGVKSFTCDCSSIDYYGETCENQIDDCQPNPCLNNGTCTDELRSFTCDCSDTGFDGETCNHNIDYCGENPCPNGTECVDGLGVNEFTCDCIGNFQDNDDDGVCEYSCENSNIFCLSADDCDDSSGVALCTDCGSEAVLLDGKCLKLGIFVTEVSWNGDLGGLSGADAKCNSDNNKPEGSGYYKALIGLSGQRQQPSTDWPMLANTTYYRANNKTLKVGTTDFEAKFNIEGASFQDTSDDTPLENTIGLLNEVVWTGLRGTGAVNGTFGFCGSWGSIDGTGGSGESDKTDYRAMSVGGRNCDTLQHLYCVEQPCAQNQTYNSNTNTCINN